MDQFGFPKKVDVSDDLRAIVLDFMINCMLEQPEDLAKFGVEFFTKMVDRRRTMRIDDYSKLESAMADYVARDACSEDLDAIMMSPDLGYYGEYGGEDQWINDWRETLGEPAPGDAILSEGEATTEGSTTATEEAPRKSTAGDTYSQKRVSMQEGPASADRRSKKASIADEAVVEGRTGKSGSVSSKRATIASDPVIAKSSSDNRVSSDHRPSKKASMTSGGFDPKPMSKDDLPGGSSPGGSALKPSSSKLGGSKLSVQLNPRPSLAGEG